MRIATLFFLFCFSFFTSCQPKVVTQGPWLQKIDSADMSYLVINFSKKMEDEHRLYLDDSRVVYNENIKKIYLEYHTQLLLDVNQARLLIVELVEEFLYRLNNHSILGFEVEEYPFTADNLDVKINFESFYGLYADPLYIGLTWLQAGCVHFYAFDRKDHNIDWSHQRFEPYFKSRELALIKKEADLPFSEKPGTSPRNPNGFIYERYLPYSPTQPSGVLERYIPPTPEPQHLIERYEPNEQPPESYYENY